MSSSNSEKNLKRSSIILLCSFVIIVIGYFALEGRFVKDTEEVVDNSTVEVDNTTKGQVVDNTTGLKKVVVTNEPEKIQTIGYRDYFLGTFENGKWYSAEGFIGKNTEDYELNCKNNVVKKEYNIDDIIAMNKIVYFDGEKLIPKGTLAYDKEEHPENYTEIFYFRYDLNEFLNSEDSSGKYTCFVVSQELKTVPTKKYEQVLETDKKDKYIDMVKKELVSDKLDAEPIVTNIYKVDTDNDGSMETYIAASNYENYDNEKDENFYLYLLHIEGNSDKAEVLLKDISRKDSPGATLLRLIEDISFVDYNNDGKMEIVVRTIAWDIPEVYVIDKVNDTYELNMYGNFAW